MAPDIRQVINNWLSDTKTQQSKLESFYASIATTYEETSGETPEPGESLGRFETAIDRFNSTSFIRSHPAHSQIIPAFKLFLSAGGSPKGSPRRNINTYLIPGFETLNQGYETLVLLNDAGLINLGEEIPNHLIKIGARISAIIAALKLGLFTIEDAKTLAAFVGLNPSPQTNVGKNDHYYWTSLGATIGRIEYLGGEVSLNASNKAMLEEKAEELAFMGRILSLVTFDRYGQPYVSERLSYIARVALASDKDPLMSAFLVWLIKNIEPLQIDEENNPGDIRKALMLGAMDPHVQGALASFGYTTSQELPGSFIKRFLENMNDEAKESDSGSSGKGPSGAAPPSSTPSTPPVTPPPSGGSDASASSNIDGYLDAGQLSDVQTDDIAGLWTQVSETAVVSSQDISDLTYVNQLPAGALNYTAYQGTWMPLAAAPMMTMPAMMPQAAAMAF